MVGLISPWIALMGIPVCIIFLAIILAIFTKKQR